MNAKLKETILNPIFKGNPITVLVLGICSSLAVTVTLKGEETTTEYAGSDALFEAPSYSWYVLDAEPAQLKTLTVADAPSFSAVNTEATVVEAKAAFVYDKHADLVITVSGLEDTLGDQKVSGLILIADDGTRVGLRHLANLWRGTQIGMNLDSAAYAALKGKTITGIEYLTSADHFTFTVDLPVAEDERLVKLSSAYIELFPEFAKEEYKDYWMECIKAYVEDDATAEMYYSMLTANFMGTLKGQEAIDAYAANSESMMFNCFFENNVAKFTVSGDVISGVDAEGNELFRHTYHFTEDLPISFFGQSIGTDLHIYQTDDADAGVFTYFAFADDTLNETYHIEFRYGEHLEDLANYSEGEYAYWLAAGINDGYKENQIKACIKLFVDENAGEEQ